MKRTWWILVEIARLSSRSTMSKCKLAKEAKHLFLHRDKEGNWSIAIKIVEIKRTDKTGNERVVGSVITARDRWLKPGGVILPSNAMLYIAPFTHVDRYSESIDFWQNVYGIDSEYTPYLLT
ncbi:protein arginine N-methyltransferase 1-like isoform X2 [Rosa chinensis]|uniref:protein arginine N-methyltransferase 1-like isoform X2 n=1 Tax=Rosa chinensis TaxID=74649 RepID=UPI001AD939DF|nr:protein arginine N-methyltransferase 1-like isoform X2 [Rosa chinensis]